MNHFILRTPDGAMLAKIAAQTGAQAQERLAAEAYQLGVEGLPVLTCELIVNRGWSARQLRSTQEINLWQLTN